VAVASSSVNASEDVTHDLSGENYGSTSRLMSTTKESTSNSLTSMAASDSSKSPPSSKDAAEEEDVCSDDTWLPTDDPDFKPYVFASVFLVFMGGTMSGLQAGMMQLDSPTIKSMRETASPVFLWLIDLLEPLIRRRHLTLVTLLVSNAVAMETLPIFLDVLVPKAIAILLSVSMVLLFGEIVPQALCLRWPGEISCIFTPLVWVLLTIFAPIVYPIAWLLDHLLGDEHHAIYSRAGLHELARQQAKLTGHGVLEDDELDIITGTLELHDKVANDICISLDHAFKVSYHDTLTDKVLRDILDHGHSRVPVWKDSPSNIIGILLVKHLIRIAPDAEIRVRDLQIMPLLVTDQNVSLFALLRRFRTGACHMAAVKQVVDVASEISPSPTSARGRAASSFTRNPSALSRGRGATEAEEEIHLSCINQIPINAVGILTLEDIIEELLKHDIEDETDRWAPVNDELDQRMSKVRNLRDNLLSSLEKGEQRSSNNTGTQGERDSLLRQDSDQLTSGSANSSAKSGTSQTNRPASLSYGSLNEFSAHGGSRGSTPSEDGGTLLRMIRK